MGKLAIAVHGGAGPDSEYIKKNFQDYKKGLEEAVRAGYKILEEGGSSLDAVEAAVNYLEDNPLFNAGRGSALNENAEVEMDASIMNGENLECGAVSIVRHVKNPVTLARAVMEKTKHIYLGDMGATDFAHQINLEMRPDSYFVTEHSYEEYESAAKEEGRNPGEAAEVQLKRKGHGTVGAVALDKNGNIAAATSTGGIENKKASRIGDSSIIGIGSYANNKTCAVSSTGDGEVLIQHITAFHISALMEYKGLSLKDACHHFIKEKCKDVEGDMGIIAVDTQGNVCLEYKAGRMHRAWMTSEDELKVSIYND
ncbi:MAG TPA: isoaspartyl peptidase/L-asparaginase [Chitinophagaceae bacterium]|jgi:beta-aspartyl-peptidase (threonine type)|nr:isoaspartyl peptidase/L-asparaginase [Chitinophagaceae bacterium]